MLGRVACKCIAIAAFASALGACAEPGGGNEIASQSAAASDNITTPITCPTAPASDPQEVLCSDPAGTSQVAGGYFTAIGEPRRFVESAQTFMVGRNGVPGRISLKYNRPFDPPAGTTPSLILELRTLIGGKIDITAGTTTTFAVVHIPYNVIPLGAGTFTPYTANFASGSGGTGYTMTAGTTYALVARVASPDELTVGIAAHVDPNQYPNGTGWIRQGRLVGTNLYSTPAFTADKRDMNFGLTLDNGCVNGLNVTCGVGECYRSIAQCTNNLFNTCVPGNPVNEQCNLKDDDCDGLTDEIPDDAAGPGLHTTTCGIGACTRTVNNCVGGVVQTCVPGNKTVEACNNIDDDCDGRVDELSDNAGDIAVAPTYPPLGYTTCGSGPCRRTLPNCSAGTPVTCTQDTSKATTEVCDGIDNDCNGTTDKTTGGVTLTQPYYSGAWGRNTGTCKDGVQTCSATLGSGTAAWTITTSDVTPVAESCNSKDDDCDGRTDEITDNAGDAAVAPSYPPLGYASCGIGTCFRTVATCASGTAVSCVPGSPTTEICDGLDNDCNGTTDKDASTGLTLTQPYYNGPAATRKVGTCKDGVQTCSATPGSGSANWTITTTDVEPTAEICDGYDQNCDGTIDGTSGVKITQGCWTGTAAQRGVGICRDGVQDCASTAGQGTATWGACYNQVLASSETCNSKDDDCNGTTDDGLGATTCGYGRCVAATNNCIGGVAQSCSPNTSQAAAEVCNGVDDDCNGTVDKDGSGNTISQSCYNGPAGTLGVGVCRAGSQACTAPLVSVTPGNIPAYPGTAQWGACTGEVDPSAEICNGKDDNCNGSTDEGLGTSTCGSGRCYEQVNNCVGGVNQSCPATGLAGNAAAEVCNGVDDDCNGTIDKDSSGNTLTQSCYTGPAGTLNVGACHAGTQTCSAPTVTLTPNSPPAYPGTSAWSSCSSQVTPVGESCNGIDDNCDGAVDNPSTSLCSATSNVTGTNCVSGACTITGCAANTYNSDGSYANGCECVDDGATTGTTCPGSPTSLGSVTKGTTKTYSGRLPNSGLSDYLAVSISPTAYVNTAYSGAVNISLTSNPGTNFKFQILAPSCSGFGSCGSTLDTFYFADSCYAGDGNDCNYRAATWPTTIYVRVFRVSTSAGGCAGYTLSVGYN